MLFVPRYTGRHAGRLSLLAAVLVATVSRADMAEPITIVVSAPAPERAWSRLDAEDIERALPGSAPWALIARLPGVNTNHSDDFGTYEWGNDLSLRGFSSGQIGWMLDDIPLGSTHFWYMNGLDVHRAISSENLASLDLVPGSAAVELASVAALGGGFVARSHEPASQAAGLMRLTLGSHDSRRLFARAETGETAFGGRGFVSLMSSDAAKWKGMGSPGQRPFAVFQRDAGDAVTGAGARWGHYQDQWNGKWLQDLGRHRLTLYANVSDKRENDYADLTIADFRRFGGRIDNWTHWPDALSGDETVYFGSAMSWRNDRLLAGTLDLELDAAGRLSLTAYGHKQRGKGDWHMPAIEDGVLHDMKFRRGAFELQRQGINSRWQARLNAHRLAAGLWLEHRQYDRRRFLYELVDWRQGPEVDFSQPATTLLDRRYRSTTRQLWLSDRFSPDGAPWTLAFSLRRLQVHQDFHDRLGRYADRQLRTDSPWLPQLGLSWRLAAGHELFAHVADNINARPETVFTQAVWDDRFQPERSRTWEAGWRARRGAQQWAVSLYRIDYRHRLLQIANCTLLGTCPSLLANVGRVKSQGVEGRWRWQLAPAWAWVGSVAYNEARYRDDYVAGGARVPTAGKTVVNAPRWLANSQWQWAAHGWHLTLEGQLTGRRAASYSNDLMVPGGVIWHLSGGWQQRGGPGGPLALQRSGWQLQVRNLANRERLTTIGSAGYVAYDANGSRTYAQVGAPRAVYFTVWGEW